MIKTWKKLYGGRAYDIFIEKARDSGFDRQIVLRLSISKTIQNQDCKMSGQKLYHWRVKKIANKTFTCKYDDSPDM